MSDQTKNPHGRVLKNPQAGACLRCGRAFVGQRNKRYCSGSCHRLRWGKSLRAQRRRSAALDVPSRRGTTPGHCLACGEPLVGHRDRKYCSGRCRDAHRYVINGQGERERNRRYRRANAERISLQRKTARPRARAYMRDYRLNNRDRLRAYARDYRKRNRDKFARWERNHRDRYPERRREASRNWRQRYPDANAHVAAARRAREQAAEGSHTLVEWRELLRRFEYKCAYCGASGVRLTRDHDLPLIRGGTHDISNIRPACALCNARKGRRTGAEYLTRLADEAKALADT